MALKSGSHGLPSSQGSSEQRQRFEKAARAIGADESDDALNRAMGKLNLRAKPKPAPEPPPSDDK